MEVLYLLFLAFLKIFMGMVLTFFISSIALYIVLRVKGLLLTSDFKTTYNRFSQEA